MNKQQIGMIISLVLIILLFTFYFFNQSNNEISVIKTEIKEENKEFLTKKDKQAQLGDYLEKINSGDNNIKNENKEIKEISLKYIKLGEISSDANYYYKEKESQEEINKILNEIKEIDNDLFDNFYGNYYLGYSQEIIKEYTGALNYYNKALDFSSNDNKITTSSILNQIGHLYDLQGDINKAYEYYFKAYNLNKQNYGASTNIARYLSRIGELEKAKQFFLYSLNSKNKILKSEIYYLLSSIELNGTKPNINKSIEYAKMSIKEFSNYPMGYESLAKGYYMLNDSKYNKLIKENLTIYNKLIKENLEKFNSNKK